MQGILLAAVIFATAAFGYLNRSALRDYWGTLLSPRLPEARSYSRSAKQVEKYQPSESSPIESGTSQSENYVLESNPIVTPPVGRKIDSLAFSGTLPKEINLDVPFTSQAPHADWSMPYQEACEEASAYMVHQFYRGVGGKIDPNVADTAIQKLVAFQKATFGYYEDTNVEETAKFIRDYYGYNNVVVKPLNKVEDIKQPLALGYPVIIPAAGKLLGNPNFRGGGPDYHMLVIRGYTPDFFITNDPGTRKGQGYTYSYQTIMNAAHDWTGDKATVKTGQPMMLVIVPN